MYRKFSLWLRNEQQEFIQAVRDKLTVKVREEIDEMAVLGDIGWSGVYRYYHLCSWALSTTRSKMQVMDSPMKGYWKKPFINVIIVPLKHKYLVLFRC